MKMSQTRRRSRSISPALHRKPTLRGDCSSPGVNNDSPNTQTRSCRAKSMSPWSYALPVGKYQHQAENSSVRKLPMRRSKSMSPFGGIFVNEHINSSEHIKEEVDIHVKRELLSEEIAEYSQSKCGIGYEPSSENVIVIQPEQDESANVDQLALPCQESEELQDQTTNSSSTKSTSPNMTSPSRIPPSRACKARSPWASPTESNVAAKIMVIEPMDVENTDSEPGTSQDICIAVVKVKEEPKSDSEDKGTPIRKKHKRGEMAYLMDITPDNLRQNISNMIGRSSRSRSMSPLPVIHSPLFGARRDTHKDIVMSYSRHRRSQSMSPFVGSSKNIGPELHEIGTVTVKKEPEEDNVVEKVGVQKPKKKRRKSKRLTHQKRSRYSCKVKEEVMDDHVEDVPEENQNTGETHSVENQSADIQNGKDQGLYNTITEKQNGEKEDEARQGVIGKNEENLKTGMQNAEYQDGGKPDEGRQSDMSKSEENQTLNTTEAVDVNTSDQKKGKHTGAEYAGQNKKRQKRKRRIKHQRKGSWNHQENMTSYQISDEGLVAEEENAESGSEEQKPIEVKTEKIEERPKRRRRSELELLGTSLETAIVVENYDGNLRRTRRDRKRRLDQEHEDENKEVNEDSEDIELKVDSTDEDDMSGENEDYATVEDMELLLSQENKNEEWNVTTVKTRTRGKPQKSVLEDQERKTEEKVVSEDQKKKTEEKVVSDDPKKKTEEMVVSDNQEKKTAERVVSEDQKKKTEVVVAEDQEKKIEEMVVSGDQEKKEENAVKRKKQKSKKSGQKSQSCSPKENGVIVKMEEPQQSTEAHLDGPNIDPDARSPKPFALRIKKAWNPSKSTSKTPPLTSFAPPRRTIKGELKYREKVISPIWSKFMRERLEKIAAQQEEETSETSDESSEEEAEYQPIRRGRPKAKSPSVSAPVANDNKVSTEIIVSPYGTRSKNKVLSSPEGSENMVYRNENIVSPYGTRSKDKVLSNPKGSHKMVVKIDDEQETKSPTDSMNDVQSVSMPVKPTFMTLKQQKKRVESGKSPIPMGLRIKKALTPGSSPSLGLAPKTSPETMKDEKEVTTDTLQRDRNLKAYPKKDESREIKYDKSDPIYKVRPSQGLLADITYQIENQYEEATKRNELRRRHRIATGETKEDGSEKDDGLSHLSAEERKEAIEKMRREVKLKIMERELEMVKLNCQIKKSLREDNPDEDKCIELLKTLQKIPVSPIMLEKYPDIVVTVLKITGYMANEEVAIAAQRVMNKFQVMYLLPEDMEFFEVFEEKVDEYHAGYAAKIKAEQQTENVSSWSWQSADYENFKGNKKGLVGNAQHNGESRKERDNYCVDHDIVFDVHDMQNLEKVVLNDPDLCDVLQNPDALVPEGTEQDEDDSEHVVPSPNVNRRSHPATPQSMHSLGSPTRKVFSPSAKSVASPTRQYNSPRSSQSRHSKNKQSSQDQVNRTPGSTNSSSSLKRLVPTSPGNKTPSSRSSRVKSGDQDDVQDPESPTVRHPNSQSSSQGSRGSGRSGMSPSALLSSVYKTFSNVLTGITGNKQKQKAKKGHTDPEETDGSDQE